MLNRNVKTCLKLTALTLVLMAPSATAEAETGATSGPSVAECEPVQIELSNPPAVHIRLECLIPPVQPRGPAA